MSGHEIVQEWIPVIVASAGSVLASNGFWGWRQKRTQNKSGTDRLLIGLAYDKIATLGLSYIERGWVSKDEYEDFCRYLYEPYKALGGNGVAERIMAEVSTLPLRSSHDIAINAIVEAKKANEKGILTNATDE